jgi:hypothetical protein
MYNYGGMSDHIQTQQGHHQGFQQDNDDMKTAHKSYSVAVQGGGGDALGAALAKHIAAHQEFTDCYGQYVAACQSSLDSIQHTENGVSRMFGGH